MRRDEVAKRGKGKVDSVMLDHVALAFKNSDVRSPIILCMKDGNPYNTVDYLARTKESKLSVWPIHLKDEKSEMNALDYLQVGLQSGDWLYLTGLENCKSDKNLREIGQLLITLKPNPKEHARCGLFRLWLVMDDPIDVNETKLLPNVLTQNSVYGTRNPTTGKAKIILKRRVDPELAEKDEAKKKLRRDRGEDSDAESDHEVDDPERRGPGLAFHRATDFYTSEAENAVTKSVENIFDAIQNGDKAKVAEIINLNTVDFNIMRNKANMTPLHWAVMCDDFEIVKLLLENEADPNVRRGDATGQPPLFLPIEQESIFEILIAYGADIDQRWEGKGLLDHPGTAPNIKEWLKAHLETES